MKLNAKIVRYIPSRRMLYLLANEKVYKIKLNNSTVKQFGRYFNINYLIKIELDDFFKVVKIYRISFEDKIIYYDIDDIKKGIKRVFDNKTKKLYLDLELSMHPYYKTNSFIQEIIQVGYILEDEEGVVIEQKSFFVKPVKYPILTPRTLKFLSITQEDVDTGLSTDTFYEILKGIMEKHNPKIIVWGRNDFLSLDVFYEINKFEACTTRLDFINLLQLYKTYHGLKNDVGLFNCYISYGKEVDNQIHNALEDAYITKEIYHLFKEEIYN